MRWAYAIMQLLSPTSLTSKGRCEHRRDFHDPVVVSEETYQHIERLSDLAPHARL